MDNCWFVLKQTHYPPPELPNGGIGIAKGAVCVGQIIPGPKLLDNVINTKAELNFDPEVPIHSTKSHEFRWEHKKGHDFGLDVEVGVPVAAAFGLTVGCAAGFAFQKSVRNFWEFDSLETFIIQPTKSYIAETIEEEEVAEYILEHAYLKSWRVYMITGVTIARGAKGSREESRKQDIHGGPEVDFANLAKAGLQGSVGAENKLKMSHGRTTDFVWAVRLTKISKGPLEKNWSYRVVSKGATFSVEGEQEQKAAVQKELWEEGLGDAEVIEGDDGGVFVIPS